MKARVTRRGGYAHDVQLGDHALVADEPEAKGGTDTGPSPTQMLAGALGSCTLITIEMYADRKGWELGRTEAEVTYDEVRTPGEPARFVVAISIEADLDDEQIERIERIARKCPVHRSLAGEAHVTDSITAGTGA